jgi:hypothetical protein
LPGGKRAVNRSMQPRLHRGQDAIMLPALQPPMRCTFRGPGSPQWEIAPAAARDEYIQQRIHHLTERGRWHAPSTRAGRRKEVGKQLPFQIASPSNRPAMVSSHVKERTLNIESY